MPGDPGLTTDVWGQLTVSVGHINAVALKLPVFWPESCKSWFTHTESQFYLKNITISNTKCHHVVAALTQKEIDNVVDIVKNPAAANLHGTLKACLLQMDSLTDYAHCESIIALPMSGDMLPSALLSKMQAILSIDHQKCLFLLNSFLRQFLADFRSHLVHDNTENYTLLSQHADEIYQSSLMPSSTANVVDTIHAVHAPTPRQHCEPQRSQHTPSPLPHHSQIPAAPSHWSTLLSFCWPSSVQKLSEVRLCAFGPETKAPAGGCIFPACWFHTFLCNPHPPESGYWQQMVQQYPA